MSRLVRRARMRASVIIAFAAVLGGWLVPDLPVPTAGAAGPQDAAGGCGPSWQSARRLADLPRNLTEVSGFVSSARHHGAAWMIRDSGNPASLYSFELSGDQPGWREFPVSGVPNHDWEDVTYTVGADGRGRVWVFENAFGTGDQKLYEIVEPDPEAPRRVTVAATYRLEFPGAPLDTESVFVSGDRFTFVTRTGPNQVWQAPSDLSASGVNQLVKVGALHARSLLAAAATSADERLLMTVGVVDTVSVFENPGTGAGGFVGREPIFRHSMPDTQREAGDFFPHDSCDIVMLSEDATVWRLSNGRSVTAFEGPVPVTTPAAQTTGPAAPTEPPPLPEPVAQPSRSGYWLLGSNGAVHAFGGIETHGALIVRSGDPAAVDLEPTPSHGGYWILDERGQVSAFGDAPHLGDFDFGGLDSGERATSLSRTPSGAGYWIFTHRGRVVPFGDALFLGDLAGRSLNGPVLDSIASPTGQGYYMVASDGGVFTFGDATFRGSMGAARLNAPVESLVPDRDGSGYWLVATDGGVFAFDAPFRGSMGDVSLNRPVTGMAAYGNGYLMVGADGGVFTFSDQPFRDSLGSRTPDGPIVAVAVRQN